MRFLYILFIAIFETSLSLYSTHDNVIQLTASNFDTKVLNDDKIWFVEFYAPWCGHCKSLAPEWKKAANALKGIVNLGAVDMTEHQSVGGPYGIKGFPTIKIFGSNKQKPFDYQGARTAAAIVDNAISQVKSIVNERLNGKANDGNQFNENGDSKQKAGNQNDVIELTDSNFENLVLHSKEMWLVEFFAPWCGHCKNLAPEWASAATQLKEKVKLGALDATIHTIIASRYGVRGYPTIKMFPFGEKDSVIEFDGGRTSADIVSWALDKLAENISPPDVFQLTNQTIIKEACEDHQLCIVAVLPHILDCPSNCRNNYLSILKIISEKHKKRMWGWLWLEAGSQQDLEDSLKIGGFGYPAMAAINTRKMKFSWLRGSFSEKGINEFLLEVAVGRSATEPIKNEKLPNVVDTLVWDGKDGELPIEEEFDLSDIELDDVIKSEL